MQRCSTIVEYHSERVQGRLKCSGSTIRSKSLSGKYLERVEFVFVTRQYEESVTEASSRVHCDSFNCRKITISVRGRNNALVLSYTCWVDNDENIARSYYIGIWTGANCDS